MWWVTENQGDLAQLGSEQCETRSAITQGLEYHVKTYEIHFLSDPGSSEESLKGGQSNGCYKDDTDPTVCAQCLMESVRIRRRGQPTEHYHHPNRRQHCGPRHEW